MASIQKRPDGRWRARYRDETGKEHARQFKRKVDGQRWLDEVTASMVTGQYVDPRRGRQTLREYAEQWREAQVQHRPTTAAHVETMLRRHVYPTLGDRRLSSILPSDVQALVKAISDGPPVADGEPSRGLAPVTVGVVHRILSGIFKAAVRDRCLAVSPCVGIKLPEVQKRRVVPLTLDQIQALTDAMPDRYRALVTLAAGTGLRQGEAFGLTVDRVAFLARKPSVTVDRQLVTMPGREPYLAPPKTDASDRVVPLPRVVVDALAAHLAAFPSDDFVFTTATGKPIRRTWFSEKVWRPAVEKAGLPGVTFHALRHFYASLLIRHGESVVTVQARLGHASATETLDTYSHLWPDSDERTREAVDLVLGAPADSLRTKHGS